MTSKKNEKNNLHESKDRFKALDDPFHFTCWGSCKHAKECVTFVFKPGTFLKTWLFYQLYFLTMYQEFKASSTKYWQENGNTILRRGRNGGVACFLLKDETDKGFSSGIRKIGEKYLREWLLEWRSPARQLYSSALFNMKMGSNVSLTPKVCSFASRLPSASRRPLKGRCDPN